MPFIYDKFFDLLSKRQITEHQLKKYYHIPRETISRMKDGQTLQMRTLEPLCDVLNCQIGDLVEYVPTLKEAYDKSRYMTLPGDKPGFRYIRRPLANLRAKIKQELVTVSNEVRPARDQLAVHVHINTLNTILQWIDEIEEGGEHVG